MAKARFDWRERERSGKARRNGERKQTAGRRFEVFNTFVDQHMAGCTRAEILAFAYMWRHADKNNRIELSVGQLAVQIKVDRRTAQRALESIVERGVITKTYTGGFNKGPNRYQLSP